ncbi:MAG TPA: ABC transporter permease [Petrotogaceae bacterium]|nr:ABC transporter permease [Petrotogaceae bacterium]
MNNRFLNLVKFFFLETFKNKSEVFYTMFFPVIFLLLFGFIFGLGDTQHQEENFEYGLVFSSGYLSDTNQSSESAYDTVKAFFDPNKLDIYADNESLKNAVLSSKVDAGIIVDETSKVKVLYNSDPSNMQKITWIKFAGENAIKRFLYGAKKDYLSLSSENIGTGRVESNQMDFLLTGIIAISILSGGMFSVINTFGRYKKLGVIKKFMVTPIIKRICDCIII